LLRFSLELVDENVSKEGVGVEEVALQVGVEVAEGEDSTDWGTEGHWVRLQEEWNFAQV